MELVPRRRRGRVKRSQVRRGVVRKKRRLRLRWSIGRVSSQSEFVMRFTQTFTLSSTPITYSLHLDTGRRDLPSRPLNFKLKKKRKRFGSDKKRRN